MGKTKDNNFVYLATAPNQMIAEMWVDILKQERIRAFFRSTNLLIYTQNSFAPCQVMVDESRLPEATELINSIREQN